MLRSWSAPQRPWSCSLLLGHKRTRWDPSAGPGAVINDAWSDLVRRP